MSERKLPARHADLKPKGYLIEIDGAPNYIASDDMGDRIILRGRTRLVAVIYDTAHLSRVLEQETMQSRTSAIWP
ncbi:hypothetical protein HL653_04340 [Sphingomonas sp. AP4-R1]|uniref:hypothetical protein n=1 Tax=Sphingomonas sp. AP4-R1 TaxID=2735134 RepID=UPI0014935C9C|nr:hypothetical protein [Sphingomonas sp. AP4-R1]QJU57118.1 hypothetical protein HL653_04340 [Sphingomonas sp. AP4-R1]